MLESSQRLAKPVAIVTGASTVIGTAVAKALAAAGAAYQLNSDLAAPDNSTTPHARWYG